MKKTENGFVKVLLIIVVVIIVALGGVAYAYAKDPMSVLVYVPDYIVSAETKAKIEFSELKKIFPQTIGDYVLKGYKSGDPVTSQSRCEDPSKHPDTKNIDVNGEICTKIINAQYRNITDNRVVFVNLMIVNKGKDVFTALISKMGKADTLGQNKIIRIERHEISWLPVKKFDMIGTQEGRVKADSDGNGESMSYLETATGQNPVTQFFISEYPPKTSVQ